MDLEIDSTEEYATRGATLVSGVAISIEEWVTGDQPSPGALVGAVLGELSQTAYQLARLENDFDQDEDEAESPSSQMASLSARFACVAATAVTASCGIHPQIRAEAPLVAKDALMRGVDEEVAVWIDAVIELEGTEGWTELEPSFWLRGVTSLLAGAGDGVAALEGRCRRPCDGESDEPPTPSNLDPDELATLAADSMFQTACVAAIAAEWFADRFDELADE